MKSFGIVVRAGDVDAGDLVLQTRAHLSRETDVSSNIGKHNDMPVVGNLEGMNLLDTHQYLKHNMELLMSKINERDVDIKRRLAEIERKDDEISAKNHEMQQKNAELREMQVQLASRTEKIENTTLEQGSITKDVSGRLIDQELSSENGLLIRRRFPATYERDILRLKDFHVVAVRFGNRCAHWGNAYAVSTRSEGKYLHESLWNLPAARYRSL